MSSTHPNLGLNYGWTLGESGWHTGMDANPKRPRAVAGPSVKHPDLPAPPASPPNAERYLLPAAATRVWAGKTNQIAVRIADAWEYHSPKIGWLCYIEDEAKLSAYKSTGWSAGIAI